MPTDEFGLSLEAKLTDLRATGASSIAILDAACGPGTWLRRLVVRARELGFTSITARGFDVAQAQVQQARFFWPEIFPEFQGLNSHSTLQTL